MMTFDRQALLINAERETECIVGMLRQTVGPLMRRRGGVLGISGGIDSSVVLALCVRAFGTDRTIPLFMPDRDSDPQSQQFARLVADRYGLEPVMEDITAILESFGCYARRDEAIKRVFPEYDAGAGYKAKITLAGNVPDEDTLNVFHLIIVSPEGEEKSQRLPFREYLQIVAASNIKQRTRMTTLYYYAEQHNFAVIGTANKNEHSQGFFVKYGDGGTDIQPISHLLKTQVYQLALYLGIPEEIQRRTPTTDTYSAHQTQEEFFFRMPFETMDLLWYAYEHKVAAAVAAQGVGLSEVQVQRVFSDFQRKQRSTSYLRLAPVSAQDENSFAENLT